MLSRVVVSFEHALQDQDVFVKKICLAEDLTQPHIKLAFGKMGVWVA